MAWGMGIFRLYQDGVNIGSTLEMLTKWEHVQSWHNVISLKIVEGDKRILMVNGEPFHIVWRVFHKMVRSWQFGGRWFGSRRVH